MENICWDTCQTHKKREMVTEQTLIQEKEFGSTRNEVAKALISNGFIPRKFFYLLTNTFECYHGKYDVNDTPVALHISKRVLTLPLYPDLPLDIVDRICDVIGGCCK